MSERLQIPASVMLDEDALEVASNWICRGKQTIVLSEKQWSDPRAWGLMLADLARHVAKHYAGFGRDEEATLGQIKEAFEVEWHHPTDAGKDLP